MILSIATKTQASCRRICKVLGYPRSSFYEAASETSRKADDREIADRIEEIFYLNRKCYGYRRISSSLDDQGVERLGIGQRVAHHLGIAHRMQAIGKGQSARLPQQAHLHQLLAVHAFGDGAVDENLDQLHLACAAGDELHHRHIVDDRAGVRQTDQRCDAASRRSACASCTAC